MPVGKPVIHAVCDLCRAQFDIAMPEVEGRFYLKEAKLRITHSSDSTGISVPCCCNDCRDGLFGDFSRAIEKRRL